MFLYRYLFLSIILSGLLLFVLWSVIGRLGHWVCRESWARKRLFNLLPQFSRLGTQGPASHVLCDFVSVCVGVMGEVCVSFFMLECYIYTFFHAHHYWLV